jgi:hypothetical protein
MVHNRPRRQLSTPSCLPTREADRVTSMDLVRVSRNPIQADLVMEVSCEACVEPEETNVATGREKREMYESERSAADQEGYDIITSNTI